MQNYQPNNKQAVAVAIVEKNNQVLIALRAAEQGRPARWAFPMGKVEQGEHLIACLERELQEELGIQATIGDYIGTNGFCANNKEYELHAFRVPDFSGQICLNQENTDFKWVSLDELPAYNLLDSQAIFIQMLQEKNLSTLK